MAEVVLALALLVVLLSTNGVESRKALFSDGFEYTAISCRTHGASLTDFGGVGDGTTSNTKAFQAAVDNLSQYASDGGSQLFVPPGKWLTGSFNLTSHFTLFLHKDAVLLASQVIKVIFFFSIQLIKVMLIVEFVRMRAVLPLEKDRNLMPYCF